MLFIRRRLVLKAEKCKGLNAAGTIIPTWTNRHPTVDIQKKPVDGIRKPFQHVPPLGAPFFPQALNFFSDGITNFPGGHQGKAMRKDLFVRALPFFNPEIASQFFFRAVQTQKPRSLGSPARCLAV